MRTLAVLLAVISLAPGALAVKPSKPGQTAEEALQYINQHLYPTPDYSDMKCSDTPVLGLSNDGKEILLKYVSIDSHGRIIKNRPPKYIYRIPGFDVKLVYPEGKWITFDRIIIRTYNRSVIKYGPVWDCKHKRLNPLPRERLYGMATIRVPEGLDDSVWKGILRSINRLVELSQAETQPEAGAKKTSGPPQNDPAPGRD